MQLSHCRQNENNVDNVNCNCEQYPMYQFQGVYILRLVMEK